MQESIIKATHLIFMATGVFGMDPATIRRNIRGNSVLYIVMSEPPHGMCYAPKFLFLLIERQYKLLD